MTICPTFGLTYPGIAKVMTLLKANILVTDTLRSLKRVLSSNRDCSFVTDCGLLSMGMMYGHAISCFIKKEGLRLRFIVNDSQANFDGSLESSLKNVIKKYHMHMIISKVARQPLHEATCNAIAIRDCLAFQNNPKIVDKLLEMNNLTHEHVKDISFVSKLPDEMMELSDSTLARKEALKYQLLLIEHREDRSPVYLKTVIVVAFVAICVFIYIR